MATGEWTECPVQPAAFQRLLPETAPAWCSDNLPTTALESTDLLSVALARAFDTTEPLMRLAVKRHLLDLDPQSAMVVDVWFQKQNISLPRYLSQVSTVGSEVDGLFIWLCAKVYNQHLNLVHGDGIWCMRRSCIPNLEDSVVVLVLGSYLASPAMTTIRARPKSCVKWGLLDFAETLVPSPFVLNQPVKSVNEWCDEVGLLACGEPEPLQQLLANVMKGPYREDLANWILEYKSHLLPVTRWLFARGLDVPDYVNISSA